MRQRIPVTPVPERPPDVEAFFSFNDVRKSPARDGYRPAHRLTDTCLTTGVHYYYDVGSVPPGAVNHVTGFSDADVVVAVNTDPEAAIFNYCTYGIVGDMDEVCEAMLAKLGE